MPCQRLYVSNGSLELELHNFGHKFGQLGMAIKVLKWALVSGKHLVEIFGHKLQNNALEIIEAVGVSKKD